MPAPAIPFFYNDLLLIGHTKKMHLFEERWVDMVGVARRNHGGIIALIYAADKAEMVVTLAEIVSFMSLGPAGCMVTVRGVARGELKGVTEEVPGREKWGFAFVCEVPEVRADDAGAKEAAEELSALLGLLDLSSPSLLKPPSVIMPVSQPKEGSPQDVPPWGTHETPPDKENFAFGPEEWAARRDEVLHNLTGVPLSATAKLPMTEQETLHAVGVLYAALAGASVSFRQQLFGSRAWNLTDRLQALTRRVHEVQGMASARRALARAFAGEETGDSAGR